jgi:hypothetical protein
MNPFFFPLARHATEARPREESERANDWSWRAELASTVLWAAVARAGTLRARESPIVALGFNTGFAGLRA